MAKRKAGETRVGDRRQGATITERSKGFSFELSGNKFGFTKTEDGAVLHVEGVDKHLTIVVKSGRLTIHETDQKTQQQGAPLIAVDLNQAIRRFASPALQLEAREKLRRALTTMRTPRQLQALGASSLVCLPVHVDQNSGEVITDPLEVAAHSPLPVEAAWEAHPGSVFGVVRKDGESLGFVTTTEVRRRIRVYFTQWDEAYPFVEWLLREMSSPDAPRFYFEGGG